VALRANLSGPVGSFSSFLSYYDATVVARGLGLELDNFSTQTADRHAMAEIAMQLVQLVGIAEQVATTQRLASISGVDEFVEDHLDNHQIGSSSMPHKVNPIKSEQVCGLARVARGHLTAILETAHTQWWERDLTNSSVERLAWRDLIGLTAYILNVMLHAPMTWKPKRPGNFEESTFYQYNQAIQTGCHSRDAYRGLK